MKKKVQITLPRNEQFTFLFEEEKTEIEQTYKIELSDDGNLHATGEENNILSWLEDVTDEVDPCILASLKPV